VRTFFYASGNCEVMPACLVFPCRAGCDGNTLICLLFDGLWRYWLSLLDRIVACVSVAPDLI